MPVPAARSPVLRRHAAAVLSLVAGAVTATVPSTAADAAAADQLSWAPPALSNPTTVVVTNTNHTLDLNTGRDYRILLPGSTGNTAQTTPLQADGGLTIKGGRNVTVIGGAIRHDIDYAARAGCTGTERCPKGKSRAERMRAMYLLGWTGTLHIEGVEISGGQIWEGVNISTKAPNSILQLQNIRFADPLHTPIVWSGDAGDHDGTDVIQSWNGPNQLRVDGLSVPGSPYQGFWLEPTKNGAPKPNRFDIRRVDMTVQGQHGWNAFTRHPRNGATYATDLRDFWVNATNGRSLTSLVRPGTSDNAVYTGTDTTGYHVAWKSGFRITGHIYRGAPPGGPFVPAGTVGANYVPRGYRS